MRLPNGYGNISKLSGNRRNPWRVRKTSGWTIDPVTHERKQNFINIGCYKTRDQAIKALAEYNANPYDIEAQKITFSEVYEKWSEEKFSKISKSNENGYKASYAICGDLYDMRFSDIRKAHLQNVIDTCGKNYPTLRKLRVLFNQLFEYAMANDIIDKDYSDFVDIVKNTSESTKEPFNKDEIQKLWDNIDRMPAIDTALIMIYTGMRIGELLELENKNIDLEERTMRGGLKTEAGKNRVIPINKKILPLIQARMNPKNKYLISTAEGKQVNYYTYMDVQWGRMMEQLEMSHKPHECRHTFATLMDNADANKLCIKRIMGHASKDITDKVYTHKDIEQLLEAVDLI